MSHTHTLIRDILEGQNIAGYYIINNVCVDTTKNGDRYLRASLCDKSGSMRTVFWGYDGDVSSADSGSVVYVAGKIGSYLEQIQLRCEQLNLMKEGDLNQDILSDLVPVAPIDVSGYMKNAWKAAQSISNAELQAICERILRQNWTSFTRIPAAMSVHHAFRNGLLMHTVDMLSMAEALADHSPNTVNRDLLICGVLLHDVGKIQEFDISPVTGLVRGYTPAGNLLGHAYLGAMEVRKTAETLGIDPHASMLLEHMLASHHGDPTFGAIKCPQFIEAEYLHALDMLDSRKEIYAENLENVPTRGQSDFIRALGHTVYRHDLSCLPAATN